MWSYRPLWATQTLLYALYRLKQAGAIPDLPVVLDSPMGVAASGIYDRYRSEHRLTDEGVPWHPWHDLLRA